MDTQTKAVRRSRVAALVAAAATIGLLTTLLAQSALAASVTPTLVNDNMTCAQLGDYDHEFKVEPVTAGLHEDPSSDFEVTITLHDTADGQTFDFSANLAVDAVFVKGGPGGNLYVYSPGVTSDTDLHAPGNDQGTAVSTPPWAGLSHISFCFNNTPEETPTPTPVVTPTPTPVVTPTPTPEQSVQGSTSTPTPTPEQSVQGATGTPQASQPDTAIAFGQGPSPVPTIAFAFILLASLGTLAWANVRSARNRS